MPATPRMASTPNGLSSAGFGSDQAERDREPEDRMAHDQVEDAEYGKPAQQRRQRVQFGPARHDESYRHEPAKTQDRKSPPCRKRSRNVL